MSAAILVGDCIERLCLDFLQGIPASDSVLCLKVEASHGIMRYTCVLDGFHRANEPQELSK
eukprot:2952617-Amphidinium_carterae.2